MHSYPQFNSFFLSIAQELFIASASCAFRRQESKPSEKWLSNNLQQSIIHIPFRLR